MLSSRPRSASISSVSSDMSVASVEDMQIFVQNFSGNTIALSVPRDATTSDLSNLLASQYSLPSNARLLFSGRHLPSSSTLSSRGIGPESTLQLAMPIRGGAPARKGPMCDYKRGLRSESSSASADKSNACKSAAQRIVGDCGFCSGKFCSKHRQLEAHNCPGLEDCKRESYKRNAEKLVRERTVAIKGI